MTGRSVMAWGLVLATGCPADDGKEGTEPTDTFAPTSGTWTEGPATYAEDGCGIEDDTGGGTFELTAEAGGFRYVDGDTETSCTLTGQDFTCEPLVLVQSMDGYGLDAEVTSTASLSGSFASADEASFDVVLSVSCEGPDCASLDPLDDCTSRLSYDATSGG